MNKNDDEEAELFAKNIAISILEPIKLTLDALDVWMTSSINIQRLKFHSFSHSTAGCQDSG